MNDEEIFYQALGRSLSEERAAYLKQVCSDNPALRASVEALLRANVGAGDVPGCPDSALDATTDQPIHEGRGAVIGPYKLLEQIGEGGMGLVYVAEQHEPVRRIAALKVIKPGMDSREVIARFEAERQALALMEHPNIAKVLDAGTTASGRPYFVMELVRGVPITQYCDEHRLPPRERLELFVSICNAVQHAHQKGIIHRDIKPTNVLVASHDGRPVIKVIDFGVAKAIGQQLTERTIYTLMSQMVGTPLYMSPEQASTSGTDVDTRTDIYALGVLLYELLTGTTPFDRQRLKHAALDEVRRIIREEEPPKPSTRLSTTDAAPTIAAQRHTEPAKLVKLVRGDLDWIVMKAMEKDRSRRYETANAFALDLERYLADEPVLACPPSTAYRLRKFARRNKAGIAMVSAAVIVVVLAVVGLAVSNVIITQEKNEKGAALAQATISEKVAQQNAARAEQQRGIAAANENRAKASELLAIRNTYAARINLAHQAWTVGDVQRVSDLLDSLLPQPDQQDLRGFEWFYLSRLCRSQRLSLDGHQGFVRSVVFSPDGQTLATAGDDKGVRLWDANTGKEVTVLTGHIDRVACLAFAPDGLTLASGSADQTVILWDLTARKPRRTLEGFPEAVNCLAYTPDGRTLATGTSGLATGTGTPFTRFIPRTKVGELKLWDVAGQSPPVTLRSTPAGILAVAFRPDGTILATSCSDGVQLWEAARRSSQMATPLTGNIGVVMSLAFSNMGQTLVGGSWNNQLISWDVATRKVLGTSTGHGGPIVSLAVGSDERLLITGSADQTVKVWDAASMTEQRTIRGHSAPVWSVALSHDGTSLATASWDGTIKLWRPDRSQESDAIETDSYVVAFSPDSRTLATASSRVSFFDVETLESRGELPDYSDSDISVVFAPDGKSLATAGTDGRVRLWEAGTWKSLAVLQGHSSKVWSLAYDRHGQTLASGSGRSNEPGEIRLWDVISKEPKAHWTPDTFTVRWVTISPDSQTLVASCHFMDRNRDAVQMWNIQSGQICGSLKGQKSLVDWVAFSPNGQLLATGRSDRLVRIWDAATGEQRQVLKGHKDVVYHGVFSPDGRTLATASWDGTAKLWHVATGQELLTLPGGGGVVWHVAFAPDERTFAMGNGRGKVTLWRAAEREQMVAQPLFENVPPHQMSR